MHANLAVSVVARHPQVEGPVTLDTLRLPGEPLRRRGAALRCQGRASTRRSPASTAAGGWRSQRCVAGANGLANFVGDISYKGSLSDGRRHGQAVGAEVAHGDDLPPNRTRLDGALSPRHQGTARSTSPATMPPTAPRSTRACSPASPSRWRPRRRRRSDRSRRASATRVLRTARNFNSAGRDQGRELPRRRRGADHRRRRHRPERRAGARLRRQRRDLLLAGERPADRRRHRRWAAAACRRRASAFASRVPARR